MNRDLNMAELPNMRVPFLLFRSDYRSGCKVRELLKKVPVACVNKTNPMVDPVHFLETESEPHGQHRSRPLLLDVM